MANFLVDVAASGDNTIIAAPSVVGQFIRILSYHISALAPVTVKLKGGSTVKDVCYATTVAAGGIVVESMQDGVLDLPPNTAFIVNLSAGVAVGGAGNYVVKGPVQ